MLDPLEQFYVIGRLVLIIEAKKKLNDTRNHSLALKSKKKFNYPTGSDSYLLFILADF